MKFPALAACFTLAAIVTLGVEGKASPYHADNIVLKNFQAIQVPAGAKVTWEFTTQEFDVNCTLEKSTDGINFSSFRTFHLVSTRQQALHSFVDNEAKGQTFYRLRITKQSYLPFLSPIVSVNLQHQSADFGQPVLVNQLNNLFGELSLQDKLVCLRLVDMSGQARIRQYLKATELERVFKPSLRNLPAGYYIVNINDAENKPLLNKGIYKL